MGKLERDRVQVLHDLRQGAAPSLLKERDAQDFGGFGAQSRRGEAGVDIAWHDRKRAAVTVAQVEVKQQVFPEDGQGNERPVQMHRGFERCFLYLCHSDVKGVATQHGVDIQEGNRFHSSAKPRRSAQESVNVASELRIRCIRGASQHGWSV